MTGKTEAITCYLGVSRAVVLNLHCDEDHLLGLIKHKQIAPMASDVADLGWGLGGQGKDLHFQQASGDTDPAGPEPLLLSRDVRLPVLWRGAGCWIQLVYSESQRQGCSGGIWTQYYLLYSWKLEKANAEEDGGRDGQMAIRPQPGRLPGGRA